MLQRAHGSENFMVEMFDFLNYLAIIRITIQILCVFYKVYTPWFHKAFLVSLISLSRCLAPFFHHYVCVSTSSHALCYFPLWLQRSLSVSDSISFSAPLTVCLKHTSNQTKPFHHCSLHLHLCERWNSFLSSLNRHANFRVPSVLVSSWISV